MFFDDSEVHGPVCWMVSAVVVEIITSFPVHVLELKEALEIVTSSSYFFKECYREEKTTCREMPRMLMSIKSVQDSYHSFTFCNNMLIHYFNKSSTFT